MKTSIPFVRGITSGLAGFFSAGVELVWAFLLSFHSSVCLSCFSISSCVLYNNVES